MQTWKLDEYIDKQLKEPEFARAWREGEAEYQVQRALVSARQSSGMSQRELSRASGVPQKTISLIESGSNTTIETLGKLAEGMGRVLVIAFAEPTATEG